MEPVTILGVAGNAVQLADLLAKLISKAHAIHRAGGLVEHQDLDQVGKDLTSLSNSIRKDLEITPSAPTENDAALHDICGKCVEIGEEIENALNLADSKSRRSKWKSFRQALKAVMGDDKVKELKDRLDLFSQQLHHRMQVKTQESVASLRLEMSASLESASLVTSDEQQKTREDIERLRLEAEQQAQQLREEVRLLKENLEQCIKDAVVRSTSGNDAQRKKLQESANASFNLWAAKEMMLKNLVDFISTFRENPVKEPANAPVTPWKVQPYPQEVGNHERKVSDNTAHPHSTSIQTVQMEGDGLLLSKVPTNPRPVQLWYPIAAGNIRMLKQCLENGADVNEIYTPDMDSERASPLLKMPPLIAALIQSHEQRKEMIEILLAHGADPNACDNGGTSAFKYAVKSEDKDVVKVMVIALSSMASNRAKPSQTEAFDRKVSHGPKVPLQWDAALAIINNGKYPEIAHLIKKDPVSAVRTACLHLAVLFQHRPAVITLLDQGISAFKRDSFPSSPIAMALRLGYRQIVQILLMRNQDKARDQHWHSCIFLNMPLSYGDQEMIDLVFLYMPLVPALGFAVKDKDDTWVHRIAMQVVPDLLQARPCRIESSERGKFWKLMEQAFDERISVRWIQEVDVQRNVHYIEEFPLSLAEKVVKWIEEQKIVHGVWKTAADLSYVLKAHIAREKMIGKR